MSSKTSGNLYSLNGCKVTNTAICLLVLCALAVFSFHAYPHVESPSIDKINHYEEPHAVETHTDSTPHEQPLAPQPWQGWSSISKLFVFGDSLSAASFDPHAEQPSPENPFGNPVFPKGRAIGDVCPDFLTLVHNQSAIQTYNHAAGGATVDNAVFRSVYGAPSFREQLFSAFRPVYASDETPRELHWDSSTTMFMIRFGMNDVTIDYLNEDMHVIVKQSIEMYVELVEELYHLGARNFVFLNLGPVESNFGIHGGNPDNVRTLADNILKFNEQLVEVKQNLTHTHRDVTAFLFDVHKFLPWLEEDTTRMDASRDVKNTTDVCLEYAWGLAPPTSDSGKHPFEQYSPACGVPASEYFWVSATFQPSASTSFLSSC